MNPNARLNAARAATGEGRFEEALSEFVWFHEHALEVDRAYRGVRLSFALTEFQRKLNEKTTRLSSGELSRDLFNDIEAMNACIPVGVYRNRACATSSVSVNCSNLTTLPASKRHTCATLACMSFPVAR